MTDIMVRRAASSIRGGESVLVGCNVEVLDMERGIKKVEELKVSLVMNTYQCSGDS